MQLGLPQRGPMRIALRSLRAGSADTPRPACSASTISINAILIGTPDAACRK